MDDILRVQLQKAAREASFIKLSTKTMGQITTMTLDKIAEHLEQTEPSSTGSIRILQEASAEVTVHLED